MFFSTSPKFFHSNYDREAIIKGTPWLQLSISGGCPTWQRKDVPNCLNNKTSRPSGSCFIIGIHFSGRFDFCTCMLVATFCASSCNLSYAKHILQTFQRLWLFGACCCFQIENIASGKFFLQLYLLHVQFPIFCFEFEPTLHFIHCRLSAALCHW